MIEHKNLDGSSWFAIHEVYYDDNGNPKYRSEDHVLLMVKIRKR
jgi:hypothetical protein